MMNFEMSSIDDIRDEFLEEERRILTNPNLSERQREKEYLDLQMKTQKRLISYKIKYDESGFPHTVHEFNKSIQKIENSKLTIFDKAKLIENFNKTMGDVFTKEASQCKAQVYLSEFVENSNSQGRLYVSFPGNAGLKNAKSLEREFFYREIYLTRYAACIDDRGYNYSQKIDGRFPTLEELCLPYHPDKGKNKNQLLYGKKYIDLIDSVNKVCFTTKSIKRECTDLNVKYPEFCLNTKKYKKIKDEYKKFKKKFKKIKDDKGTRLKDTTFGVIGLAAPSDEKGKVRLCGGAKNILLPFKNDTLEELGIIQSDALVTRAHFYYGKEFYESNGSLKAQKELIRKYTKK